MSRSRINWKLTYMRCDGCRRVWPDYLVRVLKRTQAAGEVQLCEACLYDFNSQVDAGAIERGAMLELVAIAGRHR